MTHNATYGSMQLHLDYSAGFGGRYGVQKHLVDKSAAGWDEKAELSKHESQKGLYYFLLSERTIH